MGMQHGRTVLRMELCPNIPAKGRYLDNFDEIGFRIGADALHSALFEFFPVTVIEFVTVTMAFAYGSDITVSCENTAALPYGAGIGPESHRTAHLGNALLFFHHINDIMRRVRIHFSTVGIPVSENIPGEFNHHHLHPQTDSQSGNVMLPCVLRGQDFSFDAAMSETGTNHDTGKSGQCSPDILPGYVLAVEEYRLDPAVIISPSMCQAFLYAFVSVLEIILTDQTGRSG